MSELSIAESIKQDYEEEIERLQRQKEELQVNGLRQETLFKLEIERLNKQIEEYQKALDETTSEKIDLEDIIKEVRELVNKALNINSDYVDYDFGTELLRQELLEILDKGE